MKVAQLMSKDGFACCCPHESLARASQLMWEHDCGVVPVAEDGVVVAMLTDRDVCMAAYTQNRPLTEIPISVAMSRQLHACSPDDEVEQALTLMRRHQVRRLPVLDGDHRLVGLLSQNDLVQAAARPKSPLPPREVLLTLAGIGERHGLITPRHEELPAQLARASATA